MKRMSKKIFKKSSHVINHVKKHRCCYIWWAFVSFALIQLFILFVSFFWSNNVLAQLGWENIARHWSPQDVSISGMPAVWESLLGEHNEDLNKSWSDINNFFSGIVVDFSLDWQDKKYIVVQEKISQDELNLRWSTTWSSLNFTVQTLEDGSWNILWDTFNWNIETIYFDSNNTPYIINYDFNSMTLWLQDDWDLDLMWLWQIWAQNNYNFTIRKRQNNNWIDIGTFNWMVAELYFDSQDNPYVVYSDSYLALPPKNTNRHGFIPTYHSTIQRAKDILVWYLDWNMRLPKFYLEKLEWNNWTSLDSFEWVFERLEIDGDDNVYIIWYDINNKGRWDDDASLPLQTDNELEFMLENTNPEILMGNAGNIGLSGDEELQQNDFDLQWLNTARRYPKINIKKYVNNEWLLLEIDAEWEFFDIKFDSQNTPYMMWYDWRLDKNQVRKVEWSFLSSVWSVDRSTHVLYSDSNDKLYSVTRSCPIVNRTDLMLNPNGSIVEVWENNERTQIWWEFNWSIYLFLDSNDNIYVNEYIRSWKWPTLAIQTNIYILENNNWIKVKELTSSDYFPWFWIDTNDIPYVLYKENDEYLIDHFISWQRENLSTFSGKAEIQGINDNINGFFSMNFEDKILYQSYLSDNNRFIVEKFDGTNRVELFNIQKDTSNYLHIKPYKDNVYFSNNGLVYQYDGSQLLELWSYTWSIQLYPYNDDLYVKKDNTLLKYDGEDFVEIWSFESSIQQYFHNDDLYIKKDNTILKYDGEDFVEIWSFEWNINITFDHDVIYIQEDIGYSTNIYKYDDDIWSQIWSFEKDVFDLGDGRTLVDNLSTFIKNNNIYISIIGVWKSSLYTYSQWEWHKIKNNIRANPIHFDIDTNDVLYIAFDKYTNNWSVIQNPIGSEKFIQKFENWQEFQLWDMFTGHITHLKLDWSNQPYIVKQFVTNAWLSLMDRAGQSISIEPKSQVFSFEGWEWSLLWDTIPYKISDIYFDDNNMPYITNGYDVFSAINILSNSKSQNMLGELQQQASIIDTNSMKIAWFNIQRFANGGWQMLGSNFPGWLNKVKFDSNNDPYIVRQEQFNQSKEVRKFQDNNWNVIWNLFNWELVYFTIDWQDTPYIVINKPLWSLSRIAQTASRINDTDFATKWSSIINTIQYKSLWQFWTFTMRKKENNTRSMVGESFNWMVGDILFDWDNIPYLIYYDNTNTETDNNDDPSIVDNLPTKAFIKKLQNWSWVELWEYFDGIVDGVKFDKNNNPYVIQNILPQQQMLQDNWDMSLMLDSWDWTQRGSRIKIYQWNQWNTIKEIPNWQIKQIEFNSNNKAYALIEEENTQSLNLNNKSDDSKILKIEKYDNWIRSNLWQFVEKEIKQILFDKSDNLHVVLSNNTDTNLMLSDNWNNLNNLKSQIKKFNDNTNEWELLWNEIDGTIKK